LVGPFNTSFLAGPAVPLGLIFVERLVEVKSLEYKTGADSHRAYTRPDVPLECLALDPQILDCLLTVEAALDDLLLGCLGAALTRVCWVCLDCFCTHARPARKTCSGISKSNHSMPAVP